MNPSNIKIYGGSSTFKLAEEVALAYHNQSPNSLIINYFSDGEMLPQIQESVRGSYVFFIQSTHAPANNLLELLLMIDAAKRASAEYITAVIPYFGYARQDRKDQSRVPIGAKLIANMLTTAGANRIITIDLHAPQIQGFFDIPVDNLYASAIFKNYIAQLQLPHENLIFASPDAGSTTRTRPYSKYFKTELVICNKYRLRPNEIANMTVIGNVENKNVILIDDLVDTGQTLCKAAEALMQHGAASVRAFCTHPVLSENAQNTIQNSVLTELVVANTLPTPITVPKIKSLSVAPLLANALKNMVENKSISAMFEIQ